MFYTFVVKFYGNAVETWNWFYSGCCTTKNLLTHEPGILEIENRPAQPKITMRGKLSISISVF